ncbi:MAG: 3-deoxy-D-manno-octulosonic-acid transferase [Gammaproteobacteria bacterium]|jgi:3-deoxy-D-manno-octulosonic-acid transferase
MRIIYSALMYPLVLVGLIKLFWRGFANREYWRRVDERLGLGPPVSPRGDHGQTFWVHAVSVGEVQAALPLIRGWLNTFPRARVVVSTTTPTGMARVRSVFGTEVIHRYAPYDLWGATGRFLDRVDPDLAVIVETEIWPNIIERCANRSIPVIFANARLSERSARGYRWLRPLLRKTFRAVTAIGAQSIDDARRLEQIGAPAEIITVTGSTKFDVTVSPSVAEAGQVLRRAWGVHRGVWIAASTHEGEEEMVLDAFAAVRDVIEDCLLVLVPRHPERFGRAAALCRKRGYDVRLRSEDASDCSHAAVFVGDTMGELPVFYSGADVAFVGGSLVDVGGHNMLEAAALGLPILLGPYLHNFAEISDQLCDADAAQVIHDSQELGERVIALLSDANQRHLAGERGRDFVQRNRGAGERLLALINTVAMVPEPTARES